MDFNGKDVGMADFMDVGLWVCFFWLLGLWSFFCVLCLLVLLFGWPGRVWFFGLFGLSCLCFFVCLGRFGAVAGAFFVGL